MNTKTLGLILAGLLALGVACGGDGGRVDAMDVKDTMDAKDTPDTTTLDATTPDTNTPDTNTPDTNTPDTNTPDTLDGDAAGDLLDAADSATFLDTLEPLDVLPDSVCVPSCEGRICGSDGCGGLCGLCAYGYNCNASGACAKDPCKLGCIADDGSLLECGPDGCGGACGTCRVGTRCGQDGRCYPTSCVPQCTDRVCGDDGCGGNCGVCAPGKLCSLTGKCLDHPCGLVSPQGQCSTKFSGGWCDQMHLKDFACSGGLVCGWDAVLGRYSCVEEKPCTPSCLFPGGSPKECGDNGCWGSCGTCASGWACQLGYCKPSVGAECSWIDVGLGACFGTVRWFCAAAKLYSYDCLGKEGKNCGWKSDGAGGGSFSCIPF